MTKEEQDAEIARGITFTSGEKAVYRRNKAHLMENRPRILPINVVRRPSPSPVTQPACLSARQNCHCDLI
jgi:hypothetical protein